MMEGLIHTFCETFHLITDAANLLQHALRNLSMGKRISHFLIGVRVIWVNLSQGRAKLLRVSGEFEFTDCK